MDDIKQKAKQRGEQLKLPYAGALLPAEAYALMQATGMVDDHVLDCWVPSAAS